MKVLVETVASRFGTPCFVYDMDAVKIRADEIKSAFGGRFELSYAVKANPNLSILRRLKGIAGTLDISSAGELRRAKSAGWNPAMISFTGPGKTDAELRAAVNARIGYMIVESISEAERLSAIAVRAGWAQAVLLRIAPAHIPAGFGAGMTGKPCQFGIDEEDSESAVTRIRDMKNIPVKGFHIYSGTQCLKADAIAQNYKNLIRIFRHLCATFDLCPEKLIIGSGLGIPYYYNDKPVNLAEVAVRTNTLLDELRAEERFRNTHLLLELGRYLVGEAGLYLTRVVQIKQSRGTDICICDGGMNHHLAACGHMGAVIPRNYRMFKVGANAGETEELHPYELVGPLCTTIDRLGRNVRLPMLKAGDVIAIECSGAYGLTSSPVHFISHEQPKEIVLETKGGHLTMEDISELSI